MPLPAADASLDLDGDRCRRHAAAECLSLSLSLSACRADGLVPARTFSSAPRATAPHSTVFLVAPLQCQCVLDEVVDFLLSAQTVGTRPFGQIRRNLKPACSRFEALWTLRFHYRKLQRKEPILDSNIQNQPMPTFNISLSGKVSFFTRRVLW